MTTDWVLVLDADEELPDETRHGIPGLLRSSDDVAGYLVSFRNYFKERFNGMLGSLSRENKDRHERAASYAEHSNCRLFRRDPRIFFTDRIHEGVEQQILAAGLRYRHSGFNVLHFGYLTEGGALGGQPGFPLSDHELGRSGSSLEHAPVVADGYSGRSPHAKMLKRYLNVLSRQ
jgi:hypothetical protein